MRILKIRVKHLASFEDSSWVEFGPALNFVVGQNNSGKSGLISSIVSVPHNPHRNATVFRTERLLQPKQELHLLLEPSELKRTVLRSGLSLYWPCEGPTVADQRRAVDQITTFFDEPEKQFLLVRTSGSGFAITEGAPQVPNSGYVARVAISNDLEVQVGGPQQGASPNLHYAFDNMWPEAVFFFNAQRYNVGVCPASLPSRLNPDASNLPAVLMRMNGDRGDVFRELVQHMRDIFPSVKNLSVSSIEGTGELEILVWPTVEQRIRELSVGLNQSGTGLSQVLAILAVAMTVESGVVIIDEISSFLHPAAAKALVRILESHYPHLQYIISTHSPEVISASSPSTIHLVRKQGFESSVSKIDVAEIEDLRMMTGELGVSMTDVFASERIIWVEGPTEEASFPYIFEQTRGDTKDERRSKAPQFTAVAATGDFSAKRARPDLIFDIYDRLSNAAARLTSSATFCFDAEDLTSQQASDLTKRANGRLLLLPRRHFECYLISPGSIAAVIEGELGKKPGLVAAVEAFLLSNGGDAKFKAKDNWSNDITAAEWLARVDAANLLKALFTDVTGATLEYSKRRHSFAILKHALDAGDPCLADLVEFVHKVVALSRTAA